VAVGNIVTQKQLKAGEPKFVLRKNCFWLWIWMTANPFDCVVGFWQKEKVGKSPTKGTLRPVVF
jgi:hypothetical protein